MSLQFTIWALMFGGLQGFLLTFLFLRKKVYRMGSVFILSYILVMIIQILFKIGDKHWFMEQAYNFYNLTYKFSFLYGPLAWLYVRSFTNAGFRFKSVDCLHFLPFTYSVFVLSASSISIKNEWLFFPMQNSIAVVLQWISLIVYHSLALGLLTKHQIQIKNKNDLSVLTQMNWIKKFICYSFVITVSITFLGFLIHRLYPAHNWLRFGFVLLSIFIYWISYWVLHQPALFTKNAPGKIHPPEEELYTIPVMTVYKPVKKYAHSTLSEAEAGVIINNLDRLMREEQIFKNPDLDAETLCTCLGTNRYILSQVLNDYLKQSFYEYVNGWRVESAKEMLADAVFSNHKIATIGYEAGFNSLSSFNEVFKNTTGLTPSKYKKQAAEVIQQQTL